MDLGMEGRTALVLGATGGMGWACAQALAAEQARVVIVGRDRAKVEQCAAQLPEGVGLVVDLAAADAAGQVVTELRHQLGHDRVDILVLNGGGPAPGLASELTGEEAGAAVDLLVRQHVELVHALLPGMRERGFGRIIAIGSSGVVAPLPNLVRSNLGRAALAGYLKTLAGEVAGDGVSVNMVLPGRIDTERVAALDAVTAEDMGISNEEAKAASIATIPAGRYGGTEEFAAVVAFLAGAPAAYVTGEEIRCDGGLVRAR